MIAALLFALLPNTDLPAAAEPAIVLRVDRILTGTGQSFEPGAILMREGKILAVGPDVPVPTGAQVVELAGVITPGLIDAFGIWGSDSGADEASLANSPELCALDSFNPSAPVFEELLKRGVTAVHLIPIPSNVLAGWSAVVLTGGEERVLVEKARAVFSLLPSQTRDRKFGPSTTTGSIELLHYGLETAPPEQLDKRGAIAFAGDIEAVRVLQDAANGHWLGIVANGDVGQYGGLLAGRPTGLPAIHESRISPRSREVVSRLHEAGVRPVFGSWSLQHRRDFDSIRMSAMAYARWVRDPDAALSSVTRTAADFAGVSRLIGTLAPGRRADFVLWSGHPLDSTSRTEAVVIGGRTVYRAPAAQED